MVRIGNTNNWRVTVENVTGPIVASDYQIFTMMNSFAVAPPEGGPGFTISNVSTGTVHHGGSFHFTLTILPSHSHSTNPTITGIDGAPFTEITRTGNGPTWLFTVRNITGNISAAHFEISGITRNVYDITRPPFYAGFHVSDTPSTILHGEPLEFTVTLQRSHSHARNFAVTVNGNTITPTFSSGLTHTFNIPYVQSNISIGVQVLRNRYTVDLPRITSPYFTIHESGSRVIYHGDELIFTATSHEGNRVPYVFLDNVPVPRTGPPGAFPAGTLFTFTVVVTEDISYDRFTAEANLLTHSVAVPVNQTGFTVTPLPFERVSHGSSYSFTITLEESHSQARNLNIALACPDATISMTEVQGLTRTFTIRNVRHAITPSQFNVTLDINQYTITFNTDGGTAVNSLTVTHGTTISAPTTTRHGAQFVGWFAEGSNTAFNFATPIRENLTISARWTPRQFSVSFISNGGTAVSPILAPFASVLSQPQNPTRQGFFFTGWYEDNTVWQNPWGWSATTPARNLRLYARWSLDLSTLNSAIIQANARLEDTYWFTAGSVNNLRGAVTNGVTVRDNADSTLEDVTSAITRISLAMTTLHLDITHLTRLMEPYFPRIFFTEQSFAPYELAFRNAEDFLNFGPINLNGLRTNRDALAAAINGLQLRFDLEQEGMTEGEFWDWVREVYDLITRDDRVHTNYTPESWDNYRRERNRVQDLLRDENLTLGDLKNAVNDLAQAQDNLQPIPQDRRVNLLPLILGIIFAVLALILGGLAIFLIFWKRRKDNHPPLIETKPRMSVK